MQPRAGVVYTPARIAAIYIAFGMLWIWLSDWVPRWLGYARDNTLLAAAMNGAAFVLLSAVLLFWLIRREIAAIRHSGILLRAVIEGTTDAVYVKDRDGRHLLVYNHTAKGRSPLNVAVSADGRAWQAVSPGAVALVRRMLDRERQWFDLVHLALQTDSTRSVSLNLWSHQENLMMDGVTLTHHDASHHGQDPDKLRQLAMVEEAELKLFANLLAKLKATNDGGPSLLDQTVVLHASHLGNASSHSGDNLPIILAGGGDHIQIG